MIISGKVVDSKTDIGLFSAAVYFNAEDGKTYGALTDVDGNFSIDTNLTPKELIVNLIGYEQPKIDFSTFKNGDKIKLIQKDFEVSTVVISSPRPQNIVYTEPPKRNWKKIGIYSGVGLLAAFSLFLLFRKNK
jgi:hypothetical protein